MPVNNKHDDYIAMEERWQRCRDVAAGSDAVHKAGDLYLPKLEQQVDSDYQIYNRRAVFYNASWRTMAGLIGMLFRKPPTAELPNDAIKEMFENVDGAGTPFQLFAQEAAEESIVVTRVGILVDHPAVAPGTTKAAVKPLNLRPTMTLYKTEQIINWRYGMVNNQSVLVLVVLAIKNETMKDEFTPEYKDRWLVLDLVGTTSPTGLANPAYRQRVFEKNEKVTTPGAADEFVQVGEDVFPTMGGKPMPYIPFEGVGIDDVTLEVDEPALIDLIDMNLAHYRNSATYEQCLAFSPPTLLLTGFKQEDGAKDIYIGSLTALVQSSPDASGSYIEYSGAALASMVAGMEKKESYMAVLGARMLEPQKRAVETAEAGTIHRKGEESLLASMAKALSLGLTKTAKWFVDWAEADSSKVSIEINRDFFPASMDPAMLTALVAAWQARVPGISDQGIFDLLKASEIISDDVTLEEEQARLKAQGPALLPIPAVPPGGTGPKGATGPMPPKKKPAGATGARGA